MFLARKGIFVDEVNAHTAILRKIVAKNVLAIISKGIMGYDQYIVPDTEAIESTFVAILSTRKHTFMASRAILSTFFEEQ